MEILNFFLAPNFQNSDSLKDKFRNLVTAFKFTAFTSLAFGLSLAIVKLISMYSHWDLSIGHTARKLTDQMASMSSLDIFLFGVILFPIVEELTFRGFFNLRKTSVTLSIGCFTYFVCRVAANIHVDNGLIDKKVSVIIALFVFLSCILVNQSFMTFVNDNFRPLFYLSNFFFVGLHAFNFKLDDFSHVDYLVLPILLIPYLAASMSMSFLRMRNGLLWSISFHALWNAFAVLPYILRHL
jgi:membrane protease YdiL (CAAX protease family)